jgi:hypothetical protein
MTAVMMIMIPRDGVGVGLLLIITGWILSLFQSFSLFDWVVSDRLLT